MLKLGRPPPPPSNVTCLALFYYSAPSPKCILPNKYKSSWKRYCVINFTSMAFVKQLHVFLALIRKSFLAFFLEVILLGIFHVNSSFGFYLSFCKKAVKVIISHSQSDYSQKSLEIMHLVDVQVAQEFHLKMHCKVHCSESYAALQCVVIYEYHLDQPQPNHNQRNHHHHF